MSANAEQTNNLTILRDIYDFYTNCYREKTGKPHPLLTKKQKNDVLDTINENAERLGIDNFEDWQKLIVAHFERSLKTDWNINHFTAGMIIELLFYDVLY